MILASWVLITCLYPQQVDDAVKAAGFKGASSVSVESFSTRKLGENSEWKTTYEVSYWIEDGKGNIHADNPRYRSPPDKPIDNSDRIGYFD